MKIEATTTKGNKVTVDMETMTVSLGETTLAIDSFSPRHIDGERLWSADTEKGLVIFRDGESVIDAHREYKKQKLEKAVPGLGLLRAAHYSESAYLDAFARMMSAECNDGANPPKAPAYNTDELSKQYPRAAVYLQAESYSQASHYAKCAAGRQAMALLENGGSIGDAQAILDNWLPDTAILD